MKLYNRHLINGDWQTSNSAAATTVYDSFTEETIAVVSHGCAGEVAAAVAAACAALRNWSSLPVSSRAEFARRIADELESKVDELSENITAEVGMPLKLSRRIQVQAPIAAWRATADLAEDALADTQVRNSLIIKEAVGVVAAITPWNYPLHQITGKLAPALVAGCCVVLKPSELAPAAAQALAQAAVAAGLPDGVLNIVFGDASTGEALLSHPDVDMVSFTGSTAVGQHIAEVAGRKLKRLALELGGKSASIALADADIAAVVRHAMSSCLLNSGQTCSAITRLIVPESQYADYRARLEAGIQYMPLGDPRDPATRIGPLVSARQQARVQKIIDDALDQNFDVFDTGDVPVPSTGFFVAPAIFGRVPIAARLAQEEVFGPVLIVQTYADEEEAVAIANGTAYGLAGAVWSSDLERARLIARRMRAGQVDVNGAPFNSIAPFGGFGSSGLGREGGAFGIDEFVEIRAIQMPIAKGS